MAKNQNPNKNTDGTPKDPSPKRKRNRGKGKSIIARMENVDGKSGVLLASSKKKAISTSLHWNMDGKANEAFVLTITIPDGKGGYEDMYKYMGKAQALALYEGHPRRVEPETLPPRCPLALTS